MKFNEKISLVLRLCDLNLEVIQFIYRFFLVFSHFRSILVILKLFVCPMQIEKLMIVILTFLFLCQYNIMLKAFFENMRKTSCDRNLYAKKLF